MQKIYSDWDYNLFVKSIDARVFSRGVVTILLRIDCHENKKPYSLQALNFTVTLTLRVENF